MIEARQGVFKAVPIDLSDPAKLSYILDRLVEHESEWSDFHSDPAIRRVMASSMLAEAFVANPRTAILEVWFLGAGEPQLVGLTGLTNINPQVEAEFHPIFFDGKLRNPFGKREILLRVMDWAFHEFRLHRISASVPDTSFTLADFMRKKLGFRFEAENRIVQQRKPAVCRYASGDIKLESHSWHEVRVTAKYAELGSRRFQALLKGGKWHDLLLLSVTKEEFGAFIREELCRISSTVPPPSSPSPAT